MTGKTVSTDPLLVERLPVDRLEERMSHDVLDVFFASTQSAQHNIMTSHNVLDVFLASTQSAQHNTMTSHDVAIGLSMKVGSTAQVFLERAGKEAA